MRNNRDKIFLIKNTDDEGQIFETIGSPLQINYKYT